MKLALFDDYKPGVLKGDAVVDASSMVPGKIDLPAGMGARAGQLRMEQVIEHFDALRPDLLRLQNEGNAIPLAQVRLRAPTPSPGKVLCMGVTWVDGQPRHDYNTSDWAHGIAKSIAYVSSFMTIRPGDVLTMGTNHQGIGPLQDGETAEMEVEGVGRLVFHVSDPRKRSWPREIDKRMAENIRNRVLATKK